MPCLPSGNFLFTHVPVRLGESICKNLQEEAEEAARLEAEQRAEAERQAAEEARREAELLAAKRAKEAEICQLGVSYVATTAKTLPNQPTSFQGADLFLV